MRRAAPIFRKHRPVAQRRNFGCNLIAISRTILIDGHRPVGDGNRHIGHTRQTAHGSIDFRGTGGAIHSIHAEAQAVGCSFQRAFSMSVVMMMVMVVMMVVDCRLPFLGQLLHTITEAAHLARHGFNITAAIMTHCHRTRRHRNGNILDTLHTPNRRIDLGCTGGAIHTVHTKADLVHWLTHGL